jgi:nucleoside-diphosphate-sugar epimerase
MKLLITGSNGFLGSALVRRLLENGVSSVIRCFHRPGNDLTRLKALQQTYGDKLELFEGTLNDPQDCQRALQDVNLVYHLAAALKGAAAEMFANSVVTSRNLAEAVLTTNSKIKIVVISSFGVYGMSQVTEGSVVNEQTPLEQHPERRDIYSHTKLRQELLFHDYQQKHGLPLVVLRPGVIYGPGGSAISNRVGLELFGIFLHLGRKNLIPLSYVDNCADAIIKAGENPNATGKVYNVHDDDLPNAQQFLRRYIKEVKRMHYISFPFFMTKLMSIAVEKYHHYSKGQMPAIFTPYKANSMWRSYSYDNTQLKSIGWQQRVATEEGIRLTFQALHQQLLLSKKR